MSLKLYNFSNKYLSRDNWTKLYEVENYFGVTTNEPSPSVNPKSQYLVITTSFDGGISRPSL